MNRPIQSQPLPAQIRMLLSGSMLLCLLPHIQHLSIWISLFSATLLIITMVYAYLSFDVWKKIDRIFHRLALFLVIVCTIGIYLDYWTLVGRDAGSALLVIMGTFKVFESRSGRDVYVCSFLFCFILATAFFYDQSMLLALYTLVITTFSVVLLISINDSDDALSWRSRAYLAVKMMAQALPVMLIFFIVFPRIQGPLWYMPNEKVKAITGISDQMSPGSFSELTQSDAVAFRVEFDGVLPPPEQLYWRGPVMIFTDGRTWQAKKQNRPRSGLLPQNSVQMSVPSALRYSLVQEAGSQNWLFPLEAPASIPVTTRLTNEFEIKTDRPLTERTRFIFDAYPGEYVSYSNPRVLREALQLPVGNHPRTLALAKQWRQEESSGRELIQRAQDFFLRNEFFYTLQPGTIIGDSVDTFLFEHRRGFCEHYAAAFTVLMRAVGLPARVVTGYQGGEINPVGDYMIIRQYQAHAWSEVWLEEEQIWLRVDPVGWISPERIEGGVEAAFSEQLDTLLPPLVRGDSLLARFWQGVSNNWDAANYRWTKWVLAYGSERQYEFFRHLGVTATLSRLFLWSVAAFVLIFSGYYLFMYLRTVRGEDPVYRGWQSFCRKLYKAGVAPLAVGETCRTFTQRAIRILPSQYRMEIERIARMWQDIRYGSVSQQEEFLRAVKQFRIR